MLACIVFSQGTHAAKEGFEDSDHLHEDGYKVRIV